jgi:hypothetical protein
MSNLSETPSAGAPPASTGKYFKLQIRGWTDFDPMDMRLPEIAEAIERGGGFLTAVEVLDVKDDLAAINDNVVRQGFENILAARRLLRNLDELPIPLVEDLRAALNSHGQSRKKPVSAEAREPAAKRVS